MISLFLLSRKVSAISMVIFAVFFTADVITPAWNTSQVILMEMSDTTDSESEKTEKTNETDSKFQSQYEFTALQKIAVKSSQCYYSIKAYPIVRDEIFSPPEQVYC